MSLCLVGQRNPLPRYLSLTRCQVGGCKCYVVCCMHSLTRCCAEIPSPTDLPEPELPPPEEPPDMVPQPEFEAPTPLQPEVPQPEAPQREPNPRWM